MLKIKLCNNCFNFIKQLHNENTNTTSTCVFPSMYIA